MIVLDASAVVEILIGGAHAGSLLDTIEKSGGPVIAPHLLDVEVMSAFRNLVAGQKLDSHRAGQLLDDLATLPVERYSLLPFTHRIWELRHSFTPYDAAYISLAEVTGSVLITCDGKLRKGHRAQVVVYPSIRTR